MPLAAGTRLGACEILSPLGAGGMGEVYRARDHHLAREVAIKVLPSELLDTADRAARFEREARVLASLNHPNIAHVYGFDRADGVRYLVMELVEGVTLEERLRNGPLPADEAMAAARQIVEALDAAHASGIVHRDLKPANIKVRADGALKVLDFGLAKALDDVSDADDISNSPTIVTGATRDGLILGTAAYMSPEQARGKRVDKRTDIWAFGCVVYEMLTGRQAFGGATVSDTIANVLGRDIDWEAIPASTAPSVQRLLRRCLERDVKRRLHDIADARLDLEDANDPRSALATAPAAKRRSALWTAAPWVIVALLAAGLVASKWSAPASTASTLLPQVVRFTLAVEQGAVLEPMIPAVAISPDGHAIVFSAKSAVSTQNHLYVRRLGDYNSKLIDGTTGGRRPAFSPDGRSIVFLRTPQSEITRVSLDGGAPQVVCRVANVNVTGLSWDHDGTIMFGYRGMSGGMALMRVNASGGEPTSVAAPDPAKGELAFGWPQRLPDGESVLYSISRANGADAIGVVSLKTGERREILPNASFARYAPTGHLVYVRGGNLVAQRFDARAMSVVGEAMVVIQGMAYDPALGGANFVFAEKTGAMVYVPSFLSGIQLSLVWIDRAGATSVPGLPSREYRQPSLSFDGGRVAIEITGTNRDLWIYDLDREVMSPLTTTNQEEETPQWSPDGTRVAFASERDGTRGLFLIPSDASGSEQRLWTSGAHFHVNAWSPNGQSIILNTRDAVTGQDLSVYSFDSQMVTSFVKTPANEFGAAISRDGRWVAYVSDQSGREETYIRPFGRPGGAIQVSRDGGSEPAWAHSSRALFFRDAKANQLMTVEVGPDDVLHVSPPRVLVKVPFVTGDRDNHYIVSRDDKRFLGIRADPVQGAHEIQVTLNWFEDLKRLLPP